jgi:hypothetical protein
MCLRHVGDVTVVLSKKGRNVSPQQTQILGTNLAALTPSQVVGIYHKRWAIEISQPYYGSRESLSLAAA